MTQEIHTELHFEFEKGQTTSVLVKRGEDIIGRVSAQNGDLLPFPHDKTKTYCKNSIQICGFDKISQVWQCGPFQGHKDCVVTFQPLKNEWHKDQLKEYEEYVKNFFAAKIRAVAVGDKTMHAVDVTFRKPVSKLMSYNEWSEHGDLNEQLERE